MLIPIKHDLCLVHRQQIPQSVNSNSNNNTQQPTTAYTPFTMINEHTIIDAEGKPFDVYRVIRYIKCNENASDEGVKHQIVSDLKVALKKVIEYDVHNPTAIEGLMQYRLLAPTYVQRPYRSDDAARNKLNKLQKVQYHHQKKWNRLMEMIEHEQTKHDQRELRRINNLRNNVNNSNNNNDMNNTNNDNMNHSNGTQQHQPAADVKMDDNETNNHENHRNHNTADAANKPNSYNTAKNKATEHNFINTNPTSHHTDQIDLNAVADNIDQTKYHENDDEYIIKNRIKRCINKAQRGQWKKADAALGDTTLVDLNVNNNWQKTQSKYTTSQPIIRTHPEPRSKWHLKATEVDKILKNIPTKSCGGNLAVNNEMLMWAFSNDDIYDIVDTIRQLAKKMITKAMLGVPRKLFLYKKGVPLGKPDKTMINPRPDDDVRPVTICDSVIRVMDTIANNNVPEEDRRAAMGPYQILGRKKATEIANEAVNRVDTMLELNEDLSCSSLDAINAFGCLCRGRLYNLVRDKLPDILQWYIFLYGDEIDVQFDTRHMLKMVGGIMQGLTSSGLFYSSSKWDIQQNADKRMIAKIPEFRIDFQVDYMDDGLQLMLSKYIAMYTKIMIEEYQIWSITVHADKSQIVVNTNDQQRINDMKQQMPNMKVNTDGNYTFLGIPHGDKNYVTTKIRKHLTTLYKKLQYIQRIQNMQIRINMFRKFFNYNKIIYIIKHCMHIKEWIEDINKMYNVITASIITHIQDKHEGTVRWQLTLSQKEGGVGMRAPEHYYAATKISAMSIKEEWIEAYFNIDCNDVAISPDNTDLLRQQPYLTRISAYQVAKQQMQQELDKYVQTLNDFIAPNQKYKHNPENLWSHKRLLKLVDNQIQSMYWRNANEADKARLNSLQITGASSFLNIPVNPYYGVEYSNLQYLMILSLYLGSRIIQRETICRRCKNEMDPYGWHALHCASGPHLIRRHNAIRDQLSKYMQQAQ